MTSNSQANSSIRSKAQKSSPKKSTSRTPGSNSLPSASKSPSFNANAFEPNNMSAAVGGAPPTHAHSDSVNGRNTTIPAIPSVNGNSNVPDHLRKPSNAVSQQVATPGFTANGPAPTGPQNKPQVQFGSLNSANPSASPAAGTPHHNPANLSVGQLHPRGSSPSNSPSPIPQPAVVSGGRPPSTFQPPGSGYQFGQYDPNDPSGLARPMSQLQFGSQEHMRRGSSQSIQSDVGNPGLPTGPNRGGYPGSAGRGRGGYNPNFQQMPYNSPHQPFRPQNGRGGIPPQYQGRGQQLPYQGSPAMGTRSPALAQVQPGTPNMGQVPMMPGVQGHGTPNMGQVPMMPGVQGQNGYYAGGPQHGFGFPTQADPSIQMLYNQQYYAPGAMQGQFPPQYMPAQQSPRPNYPNNGYPPSMQPSFSNQGGPPSMSRQSSQVSGPERPGSSIGQQPHTPVQPVSGHSSSRTPSISGPKNSYSIPPKKSAAITIKNTAGEVVSFNKPPASPATSTPTGIPHSVPTPPSRTTSAAETTHSRAESVSVNKSAEEAKKSMQEAIAKKIAQDEARQKAEMEAESAQIDQEKAALATKEADQARARAEALEKEAQESEARKAAEAEKAKEAEAATPKEPVKAEPEEEEIDFDAIERELAEKEAEEERRQEEYNRKKAAALEAKRKAEEEEAAAYEANMKEAERKAEEEELKREKEKSEGTSTDDVSKKLFAELKANPFGTPASTGSPTAQTPAESGTATPVSDVSMPPPAKSAARRGKAAELTLDTKKPVEPSEPSASLRSLQSSKKITDLSKVTYPDNVVSPSPALNANAPADRRFKYNKEFLLQFQAVFKEKPTLNWDSWIRDVMGDGESNRGGGSARTPSGMGNRSASARGAPAMSFGPMGSFGGARPPLPAGTTSEQRFAASNAALRAGGSLGSNPFAQFGRPPIPGMPARTPSNNMQQIPGSPRVAGSSRGGSRAESKRSKQSAKQVAEENRSMPLTAGMAITTLETSSTGWKPRSVGQQTAGPTPGGEGLMEPDMVQRKVKAALNKMTPEKFEKIADQILDIAAQSRHENDGRTLRQVIQLTFEKATDEAHWAPMYAAFCRKMLESMSPEIKDENIKDKTGNVVTGGNLFRKYLLNRCQEEFERGWKINMPPKPEGVTEEAALMSDEYYVAAAAKRRGLGLVKFIGELFKLSMLTERIMHECVKKLVDYDGTPDEAEVESLTSLLRTIGKQLDSSESKAQGRMDIYFDRINQVINIPDLNSRLKFMLMDIVDLRKKGWVSKEDDKGPKTIQEIHEEAERKAREEELKRMAAQSGGRGGGGGGRMPLGRGDARSFSQYGQPPPPDNSNRVGTDDLRKLNARNSRNPSSTGLGSLGPPSLLGGRTNSGRRGLGPGGLFNRGDDSNASSRTGTPPAGKEKEKKDESSTNAFSALAALENEAPGSPPSNPSSPPTQKAQAIERERSRSPGKTSG